MKRRVAILAVLAAALALAPGAAGYLRLGVDIGSRVVGLRWGRQPIAYFVTNRDVPGVTAPQLQAAVDRAFRTWGAVPTATVASRFDGFTSNEPFVTDGATVIGFRERTDLERTLGAATFEVDRVTGEIVEVDIFFNTIFPWSVALNGETGRFDVESIALHEVGHLLGLGHSALGETELREGGGRRLFAKRAVMFPIAYASGSTRDRSLEADDRAGITEIYPNGAPARRLGAISGRVTLNGAGIFGAHVVAFNQATGELVGGFTLNQQGSFVIAGLAAGLYVVRVEPLDDADLTSFLQDESAVNINFRPGYYERLVAAPAGGSGPAIEIKVKAK